MSRIQLDIATHRMLLADWFMSLGKAYGLHLAQHGTNGQVFILGAPNAFHVRAQFINTPPFLRFVASDVSRQSLVDRIAEEAITHTDQQDFGGPVWYSAELNETPLTISGFSFMDPLVLRMGNQIRISGWRRLGGNILLEFVEEIPEGWAESKPIFAPKCVVNVHIAVPAPCAGYVSSSVAHGVIETVGAICTFALGRPVDLPHMMFPPEADWLPNLEKRKSDPEVLTLARKGIPLDIFSIVAIDGGLEYSRRVGAALITYDAALRQDRYPVSAILYVVAAECLTTPSPTWRVERLTKRFIEFYDELMSSELDKIVAHGNFEEAFGIRRGRRTSRALRRELLSRIYDYRSGQLHEGLEPSYMSFGGIVGSIEVGARMRRALLADFAKEAILQYLAAPRSSLVGHPAFEEPH